MRRFVLGVVGPVCVMGIASVAYLTFGPPQEVATSALALYGQARGFVERAEAAPSADEALRLLDQARGALNTIIEQHPETDVAWNLLRGDPLERRIDAARALERERAALDHDACLARPTADCLLDLAFATARGVGSATDRAEALIAIAGALGEAGQLDAAKTTFDAAVTAARRIERARERGEAFVAIAAAKAELGNFQAALAIARGLHGPRDHTAALLKIAEAQAGSGQVHAARATLDGALAAASGIDEASSRAWAFHGIAVALAAAGDIEGALVIARGIESASGRAQALGAIAGARA